MVQIHGLNRIFELFDLQTTSLRKQTWVETETDDKNMSVELRRCRGSLQLGEVKLRIFCDVESGPKWMCWWRREC